MTELCNLAIKYGTDKVSVIRHGYTEKYYEMFNSKKNDNISLLEIGLGFTGYGIISEKSKMMVPMMQHIKQLGLENIYKPGASLYMWRDFFVNGNINGCDINKDILFKDDRIDTFYLDQSDINQLEQLKNKDIAFDIIIDDGSHIKEHQIITFSELSNLIKPGGFYIIEDFDENYLLDKNLMYAYKSIASNNNFTFEIFETGRNNKPHLTDDILLIFRKGQ